MNQINSKLLKIALILLSQLSVLSIANGLVQFRGSYGLQTVKPDQISTLPTYSKLTGYSADVIISPPLFPFAFGLLHEIMGTEESNDVGKITVDVTRTSGLVSMRLIDTLIFIGAIGTVGLAHGGDLTVEVSGLKTTTENDISGSYSLGVEGGVKLVGFLVGAEVGYMGLKLKGTTDQKLDGAYTKVHIGYEF